ncbi:hypothetical protein [Tardiphaga sp. OK246]|uniref:hypothetical protein n=1 Tax=Tardiphaga sp. OK246 TaxID=1855307 RepID=UPI001FCDB76A|nr:hypothetical protein [Tardiphaga sp. OK246]
MPKPLSPTVTAIVKSTVPALQRHGPKITKIMYELLKEDYHIRALFNRADLGESGAQVGELATAIVAYARNPKTLDALAPTVERIAHKHTGLHIPPELRQVLGDTANDEAIVA